MPESVDAPTPTPTPPGAPALRVLAQGPLVDAAAHLAGGSVPGALIAVLRDGQPAAEVGLAGDAQRHGEAPVPVTPGSRTDIGSITKIVGTTAALMRLVEAGEIGLDEPARRYIGPLAATDATLRDLLEHRAGLREWWPFYLDGSGGAEAMAQVAAMPLRYPPREARRYSDLSFLLLGAVLSRAAGEPLPDAIGRLALRPLGLRQTRFAAPAEGDVVLASSYGDVIERTMIETGVPYPVDRDPDSFAGWRTRVLVGEVNDGNAFHAFGGAAGHAGLFSTAADLLAFAAQMLASSAGDGPIRAPVARQFLAAGADPEQALGFRIWPDPEGPAIGHTGFPGVAFALLPRQRASVVMITNRLHVAGAPAPTEPMWQLARAAAHAHLENRA